MKRGPALKVPKEPNAFTWIQSLAFQSKTPAGGQEDGHEELLQEATHDFYSVQADGGVQGGCPHCRVMQLHVEVDDCCCLKGTCPWLPASL